MDGITYRLIRSRRKTLGIQIASAGEVIIRAPARMPEKEIRRFLEEKREWIAKHLEEAARREGERNALGRITEDEIRSLAWKAKAVIPAMVSCRAEQIGVTYGRITIRCQRTRWGSCSAKGNLNFNCMLMLCPEEVIDYVVVHELCHRREMNHSARFWAAVERACPEYRNARKWLKRNGAALLARLR